jgi:hypothetical protein
MRNTADVIGGKPIAVLSQFISGVSAINPLVAFYDIHGGKREDTTCDRNKKKKIFYTFEDIKKRPVLTTTTRVFFFSF